MGISALQELMDNGIGKRSGTSIISLISALFKIASALMGDDDYDEKRTFIVEAVNAFIDVPILDESQEAALIGAAVDAVATLLGAADQALGGKNG